jgi:hypothetical protein
VAASRRCWSWFGGHGPSADGGMVAVLGGATLPVPPRHGGSCRC